MVYTVGVSDYTKDWFFAQVTRYSFPSEFSITFPDSESLGIFVLDCRKNDDNTYQGTTWQIKFKLDCAANETETYKLRLALATAHAAELQV